MAAAVGGLSESAGAAPSSAAVEEESGETIIKKYTCQPRATMLPELNTSSVSGTFRLDSYAIPKPRVVHTYSVIGRAPLSTWK